MSEEPRAREGECDADDAKRGAFDRQPNDGAAGADDMLGGSSTGAGGDLGIDEGDDPAEFEPGPISGHQHDLEAAEPRTDSATTVHSAADLAAEGA